MKYRITGTYSVNQYGHLFEDPRYQAMKRHHPITSKQEITVDVKVAAVVAVDLGAEGFHNFWLVEPFANPTKLTITEGSIFAWHADIVRILSCSLVGTNYGIVAVDGRRNTRPDTLAIVAAFNE